MEKRRIDTHAHVVPPFYRDWLSRKGVDAGGLPIPEWSPEAAIAMMDRNGIATAILSVSTPGVEPGEKQEAQAMARRLNDYTAGVVADHPERFGFFATVTLPDVEDSVREAKRELDTLKADGIVLHAQTKGVYVGDCSIMTLLEELNAREAVVFVHPFALPGGAAEGIPAYWADFLLDTVRAAMNLVRTDSLAKYPNIKYILSHGGGFLPYGASRIAGELDPKNSEQSLAALQSFYFDTTYPARSLRCPRCSLLPIPRTSLSEATSRMRRKASAAGSRKLWTITAVLTMPLSIEKMEKQSSFAFAKRRRAFRVGRYGLAAV